MTDIGIIDLSAYSSTGNADGTVLEFQSANGTRAYLSYSGPPDLLIREDGGSNTVYTGGQGNIAWDISTGTPYQIEASGGSLDISALMTAQSSDVFRTRWTTTGSNQDVCLGFNSHESFLANQAIFVEWSDTSIGFLVSPTRYNTSDIGITYGSAGTYDVSTVGQWISYWTVDIDTTIQSRLDDVQQCGRLYVKGNASGASSYVGSDNMIWSATDAPIVDPFQPYTFRDLALFNGDLTSWDVSGVTSMFGMFFNCTSFSGIGLDTWNVGNVTDMGYIFRSCIPFNSDISSWNVSSVTNTEQMFYGTAFNKDIGGWNVSNVTSMSFMFFYAEDFNQNISSWNVSSVTNMNSMFNNALSFNADISSWNVSNVRDMTNMFRGSTSFRKNIDKWDTENVTSFNGMFRDNSGYFTETTPTPQFSILDEGSRTWKLSSIDPDIQGITDYTSDYAVQEYRSGQYILAPVAVEANVTLVGIQTDTTASNYFTSFPIRALASNLVYTINADSGYTYDMILRDNSGADLSYNNNLADSSSGEFTVTRDTSYSLDLRVNQAASSAPSVTISLNTFDNGVTINSRPGTTSDTVGVVDKTYTMNLSRDLNTNFRIDLSSGAADYDMLISLDNSLVATQSVGADSSLVETALLPHNRGVYTIRVITEDLGVIGGAYDLTLTDTYLQSSNSAPVMTVSKVATQKIMSKIGSMRNSVSKYQG